MRCWKESAKAEDRRPIEVGCRGLVSQSFIRALKMLGVNGLENIKAIAY